MTLADTTRAQRPVRAKPGFGQGIPQYATVGASGVAVNLVMLWALFDLLGWPFALASAIATQIAIVTNYLGNELWTFHRRRVTGGRFLRFEAASLTGLTVTVAIASLLVEALGPAPAQLTGIAVGAGANYGINYWWTWQQ